MGRLAKFCLLAFGVAQVSCGISDGPSLTQALSGNSNTTAPPFAPLNFAGPFTLDIPGQFTYGEVMALARDLSGNVYLGGVTTTNLSAGSGSSTGYEDYFLIKLSPSGVRQWLVQYGPNDGQNGQSYGAGIQGLSTDASGNVYAIGWTDGQLNGNNLAATGNKDGFLLAYDTNGNLLFKKQLGFASTTLQLSGIVGDGAGNQFVTGTSYGYNLATNTTGSIGGSDAVLIKFDSLGNQLFADQLGVSGTYIHANAVAYDAVNGFVYIGGQTGADLTSGTGLGNSSWGLAFVAQFGAALGGGPNWTAQRGPGTPSTPNLSNANAIALDASGGQIFVGFSSNGDFVTGSTAPGNGISSNGGVMKLNRSGQFLWATTIDGAAGGANAINSISSNADGSLIYATGDTGPGGPMYDSLTAQLDGAGNQIWLRQTSYQSYVSSNAILIDNNGNSLIGGGTSIDLTTGVAWASGSTDIYVRQYSPTGVAQ